MDSAVSSDLRLEVAWMLIYMWIDVVIVKWIDRRVDG